MVFSSKYLSQDLKDLLQTKYESQENEIFSNCLLISRENYEEFFGSIFASSASFLLNHPPMDISTQ